MSKNRSVRGLRQSGWEVDQSIISKLLANGIHNLAQLRALSPIAALGAVGGVEPYNQLHAAMLANGEDFKGGVDEPSKGR
jgi:hypothetical protein